jgi:uncharacterized protein YecT (DUF1311 family)
MNLREFLAVCFVVFGLTSYDSQKQSVGTVAVPLSAPVQSPPSTQKVPESTSPSSRDDFCGNAVTQLELNECSANEFKKADAELNQIYNRVLSTLDEKNRGNLREAQSAWVAYRDANCKSAAEYNGGSMSPMVQSFCLKENTSDRIKELKRIYESQPR